MSELRDSELFGKYKLVGAMRSGGMAELFLALQEGMEGFTKVVALKRVLPHLAQSPEFIQMFLDEARLAARLDHSNIVRIYDLGETSGRYFMAMEYLPGEDLARILAQSIKSQTPVPVDIAAAISEGVADGLHFAHELTDAYGSPLGLVHRDVNPSNIIVTYYGAVKIVDFGIAKAVDNNAHTRAGTLKGKLCYVAPEQVVGEPADRRCDVFCLGILMWEMLTCKRLFARPNEAATLLAVTSGDIQPPIQIRSDVPPELDLIVMKALAKNPKDRYQTAGELHDALEGFFAARSSRPSAKNLAQWMERLFGDRQANAKKSIAKGSNLKELISEVMTAISPAPGMDWTISPSSPSPKVVPSQSPSVAQLGEPSDANIETRIGATPTRFPSSLPKSAGLQDATVSSAARHFGTPANATPIPRTPRPASAGPSGLTTLPPTVSSYGSGRPSGAGSGGLAAKVEARRREKTRYEKRKAPQKTRRSDLLLLIGGPLGVAAAVGLGVVLMLSRSPTGSTVRNRPVGSLQIDSEPPGASISMGGEATKQQTPATIESVAAGSVLIRLEKPGYEPAIRKTVVESNRRKREFMVLSPAMAKVRVQNVPLGAKLLVDGKPQLNNDFVELLPGRYNLEIRIQDRIIWQYEGLEVKAGPVELVIN